MIRVVNLRQEKYDVYIGRGSKWGNLWSHLNNTLAKYKVTTRQEAIECYKQWIITQPDLLNSLHELDDKVLGCYCWPLKCHGDVLVELVMAQKNNKLEELIDLWKNNAI